MSARSNAKTHHLFLTVEDTPRTTVDTLRGNGHAAWDKHFNRAMEALDMKGAVLRDVEDTPAGKRLTVETFRGSGVRALVDVVEVNLL